MKLVLKLIMYAAFIGMNFYTIEILYSKNELFTFKGLIIIFATIMWMDKVYQCISKDWE